MKVLSFYAKNLSFIISDYGFYKIEAKTKTANAVEFTSNGSSNHDSGKFAGSLETKYKWKDYGECCVYRTLLCVGF